MRAAFPRSSTEAHRGVPVRTVTSAARNGATGPVAAPAPAIPPPPNPGTDPCVDRPTMHRARVSPLFALLALVPAISCARHEDPPAPSEQAPVAAPTPTPDPAVAPPEPDRPTV